MPNLRTRRFDLDWLRIIAFGLLIFYHVGMFYVSWSWHVKSVYVSPAAEPLMRMVNPWRLALLFFISGVASRFATDKAPSLGRLARSRLARLGLPVLFGVYVWVMPQAYYQVRQSGEFAGSMLAFYPDYVKLEQVFSSITPTWNHLWYLVYVLAYILVTLPLLPWLRRVPRSRFWQSLVSRPIVVAALLILPFVAVETWLTPIYPTTHAFVDDWANHAHRFMIFVMGYFVAKDASFWRSVDRTWRIAPVLAIAAWLFLGSGQPIAQWLRQFLPDTLVRFLFSYVGILYAWACMLTLLGAAQRFLNRDSRLLSYLTSGVFCYYVLHQTIIVVAGYYLTRMKIGPVPEFLVLTLITIAGCAAGYEALRRIPRLGILMGVRQSSGFRASGR
ncbi:MAG: acyltransferase family protein [Deltaproteobacteria bacterium]|jgi:hypothetical protein|nr:acyltransferase family protein [Deltaproteobacteria bacterium]MBW2530565.1 acyltransferase family protein [Deltaproteobacteria bacterium]